MSKVCVSKCSVISDIVLDNFVLMLDPYFKSLYQLDLNQESASVQASALRTAANPRFIAYDDSEKDVYWYVTLCEVRYICSLSSASSCFCVII